MLEKIGNFASSDSTASLVVYFTLQAILYASAVLIAIYS